MSGRGGEDAGSSRAAGPDVQAGHFWEHLLSAFQRHRADLEGRPQTSGLEGRPQTPGAGSAGDPQPAQGALPTAAERPRSSTTDAVARTAAVLLGGTLCEYAGGAATARPQAATAPPAALARAAAGALRDGQGDVLRRSMQLALRETLEADLLGSALGRRSHASTEVTALGDVTVVADSELDESGLGGQRALEETQSLMGASQMHLGDASFDGYRSGETRDHEASFTGGLVDVLHMLGDTLTLEGDLDGGLVAMLRRLGENDLDVTARQARQLGHVLAGDRLSDSDIQALPKVSFNKTEEQTCAVCLVGFEQGEVLTQLHCDHFFHVGCIAEWMQRATRCPLCRADCSA